MRWFHTGTCAERHHRTIGCFDSLVTSAQSSPPGGTVHHATSAGGRSTDRATDVHSRSRRGPKISPTAHKLGDPQTPHARRQLGHPNACLCRQLQVSHAGGPLHPGIVLQVLAGRQGSTTKRRSLGIEQSTRTGIRGRVEVVRSADGGIPVLGRSSWWPELRFELVAALGLQKLAEMVERIDVDPHAHDAH